MRSVSFAFLLLCACVPDLALPPAVQLEFLHVASSAEGVFDLVLTELVDEAGNAAGDVTFEETLVVDGTPPKITLGELLPSTGYVNAGAIGGEVSIAISVDEPLSSPPSVRVGLQPASCAKTGALSYVCSYAVTGEETEGPKSVRIDAVDAAGNAAEHSQAQLVFDFTPPSVEMADVAYAPAADNPLAKVSQAKAGTQIVVVAVPSEPLSGDLIPTLHASSEALLRDRLVLRRSRDLHRVRAAGVA